MVSALEAGPGPRPWRRRRATLVAGALAGFVGLVSLTGCGLRVTTAQQRSALEAALGRGQGQLGAGGGTGGYGGLSGGLASAAGSAQGGGGPAASSPAAALATAGSLGGSGAAASPAGGNGGATDVGVTANSITVGNVSDLGGPVPGLFQGGPYGVQAYFDYVNSQGGVYGRMLKLSTSDDQLQCSQNEAAYQNTVGGVFAYVGSWSLDDNCGAQVMSAHPSVPMVQTYLSPDMSGLPNAFGISPYSQQFYLGPWLYFKQKYPDAIGSVGTLVGNQASAVAAWKHLQSAIQSIGYKVTYEDDFPPAQSNFSADVIRMKSENVKMVVLSSVNAPDAAIFASEASQQGFHPEVWVCPVCYSGSYVSEAGGASSVEGQYQYENTAAFLGDASVPEVSTFLKWLHTAYPSFSPDEFSAYSWANAALFVHILQQVGPHLTQKAVVAALGATSTYNDNGMVSTAQIGARKASVCYDIFQLHGGQYVKVDDPPTGFRCDGYFAG